VNREWWLDNPDCKRDVTAQLNTGLIVLFRAVLAVGWDNREAIWRVTMATVSENVIIKDPEVLGGEPVFRGTRVPFKVLTDYLEGGDTLDQFLEEYPSVSRELAIAAIEKARLSLVAQLKWEFWLMSAPREHFGNASQIAATNAELFKKQAGLESGTANFWVSQKLLLMCWSP
jgi:uncharacterized protein (DUF433 family)